METNNQAFASGVLLDEFRFSHESFGERFYSNFIGTKRNSGVIDNVPILVSEKMIDSDENWKDKKVFCSGEFRAHAVKKNGKLRSILYILSREFYEEDIEVDQNYITLVGQICKEPMLRETPLGRKVCDVSIEVKRKYERSDRIPCICWGRDADWVSRMPIGRILRIDGRIQSRQYVKKFSNKVEAIRTAYEVSSAHIEIVKSSDTGGVNEEHKA